MLGLQKVPLVVQSDSGFAAAQQFPGPDGKTVYEMPVAAMGAKQSAQRTTEFPIAVVDKLSSMGLTGFTYVDEGVLFHGGPGAVFCHHLDAPVAPHLLGLALSWEKDRWTPPQEQGFIGWRIDPPWQRLYLTTVRHEDIRTLVKWMIPQQAK